MQSRAWLCVAALDEALTGREWLLGDHFSAADILTGYTLMLMENLAPGDLPSEARRYWAAISAREGFQRAIAA